MAITRPIKGWSLARSVEFEENNAQGLVFEGLTLASSEGHLLPGLAVRWASEDGKVFVFHLRRGVRFHDGTTFTAGDVIRAWQRAIREPGSGSHPWPLDPIVGAITFGAGRSDAISGLIAIDDSTIRIELAKPFAAFPATLARGIVAVPAVASTDSIPIGTGPWVFDRAGAADRYRFTRNREYWGPRPVLDALILRVIPESQLAAEFDRGAVDCAPDVSYKFRRQLLARTDLNVTTSTPVGRRQVAFNFRNPDLGDLRVRRAMQMAIDVARLARETGNDNTIPAAGVIPPGYPGYDSTLAPLPYDPAQAKRLLAEAGYRPRRPLRLWATTASSRDSLRSVSYRIRDYLLAVGIAVEVYVSDGDWSLMTEATVDLNSETVFPRFADSDHLLFPRYHSSDESGGGNEGAFKDPAVDRLLEQSRSTMDPVRRAEVLREVNRTLHEKAAVLSIWFTPLTTIYSPRLDGCPAGAFPTTLADVRLASVPTARQ